MDLIRIKLAEKEFSSMRSSIIAFLNLFSILYLMWLVVNIFTGLWMHFSLEVHEKIIECLGLQIARQGKENFYGFEYFHLWMEEVFFIVTIVSQVGYGSNYSLPDVGKGPEDFTTCILIMFWGLILFQFLQVHLTFFFKNSKGNEVQSFEKLDMFHQDWDNLILQFNQVSGSPLKGKRPGKFMQNAKRVISLNFFNNISTIQKQEFFQECTMQQQHKILKLISKQEKNFFNNCFEDVFNDFKMPR